ncbi:MAG: hypothetical protein Q8Q28_17375, partial [Pseudomonadota bacterium]|nr:hypothetical protein [Pseudomonadota bacterium]
NHSHSPAMARICNAALAEKTPFYGPDSVQHHTSIISVALTNNPALTGLSDLAAARAVLTSQSGGTTVDLSGMNENDRATFRHIFGKSLAAAGQALPEPPTPVADLSAMTPNERAKYLHAFGPSLAANGQQVIGEKG